MTHDFEELCLPCYNELVAFAAKRLKNEARARDIVQDSVLQAWQAWDRWVPQGNPVIWARAWMFRIVSNTLNKRAVRDSHLIRLTNCNYSPTDNCTTDGFGAVDKQHRRINAKNLAVSDQVAGELHQDLECVHPYMRPDDLGDEVREALARIRPEYAEVVRLVYLEDVPESRVSEILGIARGTVRSRMARGRMALARILGPYARQRFGFSSQADHSSTEEMGGSSGGGADEAANNLEPTEPLEPDSNGVDREKLTTWSSPVGQVY